jgi:hypothetical protein
MTRRPAASATPQPKHRKRERITRSLARRPAVAPFAASVTKLGMQLFTLVRMGHASNAPLFPAHLRSSANAMGILSARLPAQPL